MRKGVDAYKACALLLFNTIVLFAILNFVLFAAYKVKGGNPRRWTQSDDAINTLGMSALREVYPGYYDDDIRLLMQEIWDKRLEYDPFTQFKERTRAGKWVNVDKNGYRLSKNNGPWPPDPKNLNIFLFGGSTAFGYGVADDQTIASHLQEFLGHHCDREAKVYNFGTGYFYSNQERTLFLNLLTQGNIPHVAIFIDGLNDFFLISGEPKFTRYFSELIEGTAPGRAAASQGMLATLPIQRFIASLNKRIGRNPTEKAEASIDSYDDTEKLMAVIGRYTKNKRLIEAAARVCGVNPVFVWQPVPTYHYNLSYHLFGAMSSGSLRYSQSGYPLMFGIVKENPKDYAEDFLWLADIQEDEERPLYVDSCHYTGEFSRVIALHIGRFLFERQIIKDEDTRRQASNNKAVSRERCATK